MRINLGTLSTADITPRVRLRTIGIMAKKQQTAPKNFEEGLAELEDILEQIESGKVGLEESLSKHERGTFLIQHCRGILNRAEKQIELLTKSEDGGIDRTPLEESATSTITNTKM